MGAWKGVQSRGWTDGHMDMVDDKEQEMMNNVALFRTFYVGEGLVKTLLNPICPSLFERI